MSNIRFVFEIWNIHTPLIVWLRHWTQAILKDSFAYMIALDFVRELRGWSQFKEVLRVNDCSSKTR